MEEWRRIPRAYLDDPHSAPLKEFVSEAYNSMDRDEYGLVSFPAFSAHMTKIGRTDLAKKAFFEKFDSDRDGKLDQNDVTTLGYAACSGRRICRGCDCFIENIYFTCATCFHNSEQPYVLCLACHQNIRYLVNHEHKDFIDNFLLLELLRMEKSTRETSNQASMARSQASSSKAVADVMPSQNSSSVAVVIAQPVKTPPQPFHWRDGLTIAGIGVSATTFILSQCSIM